MLLVANWKFIATNHNLNSYDTRTCFTDGQEVEYYNRNDTVIPSFLLLQGGNIEMVRSASVLTL